MDLGMRWSRGWPFGDRLGFCFNSLDRVTENFKKGGGRQWQHHSVTKRMVSVSDKPQVGILVLCDLGKPI